MKEPDFNIRLDGESFPSPTLFSACVLFVWGGPPHLWALPLCLDLRTDLPAFFSYKKGKRPEEKTECTFFAVKKFLGEECSSRRREGFFPLREEGLPLSLGRCRTVAASTPLYTTDSRLRHRRRCCSAESWEKDSLVSRRHHQDAQPPSLIAWTSAPQPRRSSPNYAEVGATLLAISSPAALI